MHAMYVFKYANAIREIVTTCIFAKWDAPLVHERISALPLSEENNESGLLLGFVHNRQEALA